MDKSAAFKDIQVDILPQSKKSGPSAKLSQANEGAECIVIPSEHDKASSKWAIVRDRGIPLALGKNRDVKDVNPGRTPMIVTIEHEKAKAICNSKKVVVYDVTSDELHGFNTWEDALGFIAKEKPQKWWLDSKEPPELDACQKGKLSLIGITEADLEFSRLLCPWTCQYSWEREDGNIQEGDLIKIFDKTPRDQFAITESRFSEVLLFSLNMPMCSTQMAETFYPNHRMSPYLNSQHPLFNPYGESETAYGAACDSRMKDRNFDMPYIMLRGKNFFVSYGWSFNNVCQSLRYNFINTRAHQQLSGMIFKDNMLDNTFARAFELCCSEIERLVDECTAGADACDEKREQFATSDSISKQKDFDSNEYLRQVYDEIVKCNRLIRNLLPKKAVFQTVQTITQGASTWPTYIGKSCTQRLEAAVSVFSYVEARAVTNQEQLKSLQESCLSMINLGITKQGTVMNIIMKRFAVVTIIFAPLTLVTGFFGMNVPIPGPSMNIDDHDGAYVYFWAIFGAMASCAMLMWFLFKKLNLWE